MLVKFACAKEGPCISLIQCMLRNKEVLESLGEYTGVGIIDMASFADIKKPVEDLVNAEIASKKFQGRLLEGLMPAAVKAPIVQPTRDSNKISEDPSG